MEMKDVEYVVCVGEDAEHIDDSILTHCVKCNCKVWMALSSIEKKPVCIPCVGKLADEAGADGINFCATKESFFEAMEHVAKCDKAQGYRPIPEYGGNHMTISSWIKAVKDGLFVDYDGYGYLATDKKMSSIKVVPSDVGKKRIDLKFSHIVWFNR